MVSQYYSLYFFCYINRNSHVLCGLFKAGGCALPWQTAMHRVRNYHAASVMCTNASLAACRGSDLRAAELDEVGI